MNPFTALVWDVIAENEELLEELTAIMRQEHKPFLTQEQAFTANTHILKSHLLAKFTKWLEWLPTLPIDQIGCALAEEAIGFVEWDYIAQQLREKILRTNLAALKLPTPSTTA